MTTIRISQTETVTGYFDDDEILDTMTVTTWIEVETGDDGNVDAEDINRSVQSGALAREMEIDLGSDGSIDTTGTTELGAAIVADVFEGPAVDAEAVSTQVLVAEADLANTFIASLPVNPTGEGALSFYGDGVFVGTVLNRIDWMLTDVANELELTAAASPIDRDIRQDTLQPLLAELREAIAAAKADPSFEALEALIPQVVEFVALAETELRNATGAGLAFEGAEDSIAFADPVTLSMLAEGAGFAPDPRLLSAEYAEIVDAEIDRLLEIGRTNGFGDRTPAEFVNANFSSEVIARLEEIVRTEIMGRTFDVTFEPPGTVTFPLVVMDIWSRNHYVDNAVTPEGTRIDPGFGADVAYEFTGPNVGLDELTRYSAWADAPEPLTWNADTRTLTDANGMTVKMNIVFSAAD